MESRQSVERIIEAPYIVPIEPANTLLTDSAVVIDKGIILGIFPTEEVRRRFQAKQWDRMPGHVLIPGLINLHTHSAMTLMRGMADDMALMPWLTEKIWPTEQKVLSW